jgi:protoporphyrinogen oxidase
MKKVAVIGAGPAGMTAAYELAKGGVKVEVFEAGPQVGGLAKTITLWGQKVDLGPHRFFSDDSRVNRLWLEVVGRDYRMVDRLTRIYYGGKFYRYPLKPFEALRKLGPIEAVKCLFSYIGQRIRPTRLDGSFETWVVSRFGRRLFDIFFKTYSEKLWGIPCTALDADFAAQRIKKLSLWEAVVNGLTGGRRNRHKTLVDQFAYPIGGTGEVYERMHRSVLANGGQVHLKRPVDRVIVEDGRAIGLVLTDGERLTFDRIISTMPLTQLVKRLPDAPPAVTDAASALKFRNTILVYLHLDANNLFPDNWLYVHAGDLQMGRVTNFRNWVPELYGDQKGTILVIEYWCYDRDELWSAEDSVLIKLAWDEMKKTGLTGNAQMMEGHVHRIPKCYPVYSRGYKEHLHPIEEYLSTIRDLSVIGRYGAFKYNNQDHSILMGLLAAENILHDRTNDLWGVNTDYEDYQERSLITAVGLTEEMA